MYIFAQVDTVQISFTEWASPFAKDLPVIKYIAIYLFNNFRIYFMGGVVSLFLFTLDAEVKKCWAEDILEVKALYLLKSVSVSTSQVLVVCKRVSWSGRLDTEISKDFITAYETWHLHEHKRRIYATLNSGGQDNNSLTRPYVLEVC